MFMVDSNTWEMALKMRVDTALTKEDAQIVAEEVIFFKVIIEDKLSFLRNLKKDVSGLERDAQAQFGKQFIKDHKNDFEEIKTYIDSILIELREIYKKIKNLLHLTGEELFGRSGLMKGDLHPNGPGGFLVIEKIMYLSDTIKDKLSFLEKKAVQEDNQIILKLLENLIERINGLEVKRYKSKTGMESTFGYNPFNNELEKIAARMLYKAGPSALPLRKFSI